MVTGLPLQYPGRPLSHVLYQLNVERCRPYFTPVIPILVKETVGVAFYSFRVPSNHFHQPASLRCIAVLAGDNTRQFVLNNLSMVGNAMVLEYNARSKFDELVWAVEASDSVSMETLMKLY